MDRDGVVNEKMQEGRYVVSWDKFHPLPGVPEAIGRLNRAGIRVVVVSNQRGIALGLYTSEDVHAIHNAFQSLLETCGAHVDGFYFCPHDKGQCDCRKPLPGMFRQVVAEFSDVAAETSVMIGDSLSDIEFGRNLGMQTIFIESNSKHSKPGSQTACEIANMHFSCLAEAVDVLLGHR
jgi:D-glycero-D-manno-heptose 1,7-bisphosphate phosphatase